MHPTLFTETRGEIYPSLPTSNFRKQSPVLLSSEINQERVNRLAVEALEELPPTGMLGKQNKA